MSKAVINPSQKLPHSLTLCWVSLCLALWPIPNHLDWSFIERFHCMDTTVVLCPTTPPPIGCHTQLPLHLSWLTLPHSVLKEENNRRLTSFTATYWHGQVLFMSSMHLKNVYLSTNFAIKLILNYNHLVLQYPQGNRFSACFPCTKKQPIKTACP